MTRSITQQIQNDANTYEIKMNNTKYIYNIPKDLLWINRKLVRIFYNDEENFEPIKIQFFDERGSILSEDRKWI